MVKTISARSGSEQLTRSSSYYKSGTVPCTICSAHYAPTQANAHLVQASHSALESAFMSMCHFCFRCRRPACPLCWDDVHNICGACVVDVHLPFRKEVEPLPLNSTLLVSPPARPQTRRRKSASYPLVCVFPGRFEPEASDASDIPTMAYIGALSPIKRRRERETPAQEVEIPTFSTFEQAKKGFMLLAQRIESVVTLILGIILFLVAILIVAASLSNRANTLITDTTHVDIRMEIEYLLQLIQQIH